MKSAFLAISNLFISFGGIKALQDISFSLAQGEIFSVIGPNGAGKTTLFNCISGLYRPDTGSIRFKDTAIEKKKPDAIARLGVARTFQNIELFSHMNTMENIMLGRHLHMRTGLFRGMCMWGRKSAAAKEEVLHRKKVEQIIDLLELQNVRNTPVGALPYGTQKLIELARALALEPELLLLDEPCAGMNQEEKQDMIFWIKDIQDDMGITILLIEHDMKLVMDISDRVLAINFGQPVTLGTPEAVQQNKEVRKAYIGEEEQDGPSAVG
ncbi:MAG TPA: ABC transporter ATP-binding protein [Desulfotignum sp.]|nr:ABC transporter ATP-binding protein [Desulfotignum sp.]